MHEKGFETYHFMKISRCIHVIYYVGTNYVSIILCTMYIVYNIMKNLFNTPFPYMLCYNVPCI